MNDWLFLLGKLSDILLPFEVFIGIGMAGILTRKILFRRLELWAEHTKTRIDDIFIDAFKRPFVFWSLMLGVFVAMRFSGLTEQVVAMVDKALLVLVIFSFLLVLSRVISGLIQTYASHIEGFMPATSLTENISRIVIFGVGVLIILNTLGISITPILATLGVGGLAVALALQETLTNLFGGFHVSMARQVRIGDYVKLETGEEGYVTDINWRTTRIRMLPNNVVLVPNAKLAQAIITNYYLPDKEMAVLVNLGVHYDSDLELVEKVTCEVGREVMKSVSGGVPDFEPFIRFHTFGDFSINFSVILRCREFVDQYLVKHEFVKKLHERYRKEGIVIPYPIRAINTTQEPVS